MVDGHEALHLHADFGGQPAGDGLDISKEFLRILLRDESKAKRFSLCHGWHCQQGARSRSGLGQKMTAGQQ